MNATTLTTSTVTTPTTTSAATPSAATSLAAGTSTGKTQSSRRPVGERGSAVIEAAVCVPAFMLFVLLIVVGGRLAIAHQAVQAAAVDAARAASISRTREAAHDAGARAAAVSLANQGLACVTQRVDVDTVGFAAPVGRSAKVTATVGCLVDVSDLSLPGVPGTYTVTAAMSSPIDTYRER